ncbi:hypothetical protein D3C80_1381010 [compost metagenome]
MVDAVVNQHINPSVVLLRRADEAMRKREETLDEFDLALEVTTSDLRHEDNFMLLAKHPQSINRSVKRNHLVVQDFIVPEVHRKDRVDKAEELAEVVRYRTTGCNQLVILQILAAL